MYLLVFYIIQEVTISRFERTKLLILVVTAFGCEVNAKQFTKHEFYILRRMDERMSYCVFN